MPEQESSSRGFAATLKAKFGPLPVWAWLAIVTIVLLGWWLYEQHKNPAPATPSSSGTAPGVVVISQDGTVPPAEPQPNHHAKKPEPKPKPKPKKSDRKQDAEHRAQHHHQKQPAKGS